MWVSLKVRKSRRRVDLVVGCDGLVRNVSDTPSSRDRLGSGPSRGPSTSWSSRHNGRTLRGGKVMSPTPRRPKIVEVRVRLEVHGHRR